MLTKDKAHEIFEYRDGVLYWKNPTGRRAKAGDVAGSKTTYGYISVMINNKRAYVHRVVYLMHHGEFFGDIDHINGIKSDNRIENLRSATRSQNLCNTKARGETKGVYWNKRDKRWFAQICFQGKRKHIGSFISVDAARKAVSEARDKLHGEFANHG